VLSRLPSELAVPAAAAVDMLGHFAGSPLRLSDSDLGTLVETLAGAGVSGGASYDGLVALEAHAQGRALLSLDQRAQEIYRRLCGSVPSDCDPTGAADPGPEV